MTFSQPEKINFSHFTKLPIPIPSQTDSWNHILTNVKYQTLKSNESQEKILNRKLSTLVDCSWTWAKYNSNSGGQKCRDIGQIPKLNLLNSNKGPLSSKITQLEIDIVKPLSEITFLNL